mmetsp:Transcript_16607/g.30146  ORF Transcript_16607/g.30146 Transcript_16607/m.30146 type:complete len:90 (-) Transcript_16607:2-271(-)
MFGISISREYSHCSSHSPAPVTVETLSKCRSSCAHFALPRAVANFTPAAKKMIWVQRHRAAQPTAEQDWGDIQGASNQQLLDLTTRTLP